MVYHWKKLETKIRELNSFYKTRGFKFQLEDDPDDRNGFFLSITYNRLNDRSPLETPQAQTDGGTPYSESDQIEPAYIV